MTWPQRQFRNIDGMTFWPHSTPPLDVPSSISHPADPGIRTNVERRHAAILSADAKGFSRLMGEDEVGTVCTLIAYRAVMRDVVAHHHGRILDSPGDKGSDFEEAIVWGCKAMSQIPNFTANLRFLAASLAATGRQAEAREVGQALLAVEPGFGVKRVAETYAYKDAAPRMAFAEHPRSAGLPD